MTDFPRLALTGPAIDAWRLVRDVLDGGTGKHPVSPMAVVGLANAVIGLLRARARRDEITDEDADNACVRWFIDQQIEIHTLDGLADELGDKKPDTAVRTARGRR